MIYKHLSSWFSVFCARLGASTTSFLAQNTAKSALKSTLFAYFFNLHFSCRVLLAWLALGILVVINNEEWNHF